MKLIFPSPDHGANRLFEAALGAHSGESGAFLLNGRAAALPFEDQARDVLDRVDAIYRHEYRV